MAFDLSRFIPYMLNRAAEAVSAEFQPHYRERYGMLRTEWRVLFHLGRQPDLTAREICKVASLHKTKVSRAVQALQDKGFVQRKTSDADKRFEHLSLTRRGHAAFDDLTQAANIYEDTLRARLSDEEIEALRLLLGKLMPASEW